MSALQQNIKLFNYNQPILSIINDKSNFKESLLKTMCIFWVLLKDRMV